MDPLSHALVGATAAALRCKKREWIRPAVLCGVMAGMAPDLDIMIREANNPMLGLGFHRHFTHALVFVPLGALLVAAFLWLLLRRTLPFIAIYGFCFLGMVVHGMLDSMTNYGTHLFWPFTDRRESWSIISIIDPIFTLTLLVLVKLTLIKRTRRFVAIGAAFALSYWALGFYQKQQATDALLALAQSRGHTVERLEVKPSFANLVVWRGQYLHQGRIYMDAYQHSLWGSQRVYEGVSLPLYTIPPEGISEVQRRDAEFFAFFSDGWLAEAPQHTGLIGDARFSMLPQRPDPIWGIRFQPDQPEAHVRFDNVRTREEGDVAMLWRMIQGKDL